MDASKIIRIAEDFNRNEIAEQDAQEQIAAALNISNWVSVAASIPPENVDLLVKALDNRVMIARWRPAYNIFDVQNKKEDAWDWQWKLI